MSPQKTTADSLSMLADSCIASAQKDQQRRAIFASSADHDSHADVSAELSQIMKSVDSPDSMSEPGLNDSGLPDVSFSGLVDLSMVRASKDNTPFHKLPHELSPIAAKSPEISMTPFLNVFNLDASSASGGDSRGAVLRSAARHGASSSSGDAALDESAVDVSASLNCALFGTSTKRKHHSMSAGDGDDEDATMVYPHHQSLRYHMCRHL
jgi:hypothetical protein